MGLDRHDLHGSVISFELSFSDLFVLFCFISCVLQISRQLYTCLKTKVRPIRSLYFPDVTLKDNLGNKTKLIIFQSYVRRTLVFIQERSCLEICNTQEMNEICFSSEIGRTALTK